MIAESGIAQFTPTKADFVAFSVYTLGRSRYYRPKAPPLRIFSLLTMIGIVAAVYGGGTRIAGEPRFIALFIFIVVGATGLLLITRPLLLRFATARALAASEQESLLKPTHVELSAEGVRYKSEATESLTRWKSIIDIVTDTNSLYLYFTSTCAVMVPRRAFSDAASFVRFEQIARSLWQTFGRK